MFTDKPKRARQYMIDLQRWRSVLALIACGAELVCSLIAINGSLINQDRTEGDIAVIFRYFTILSNIFNGFAVGCILPFAVEGIRKKRFVCPRWLSFLHYAGTIGTTLTMAFSLGVILPYDPVFAVGSDNLYLHVICPVMCLLTFFLVESGYRFRGRDSLICLIPFTVYSLTYLVMVVFIGEVRGGWKDMYMLNSFVPFWVSMPSMWLLAWLIAFGIRKLANRLNRRRQIKALSAWTEDMDPIAVNIEIYGLGRFYGLRGDRENLSVPYDILQALAARYSLKTEKLVRIFTKGLADGAGERYPSSGENRD